VNSVLLLLEVLGWLGMQVPLADDLLVSCDGGQTWSERNPDFSIEQSITAVAARLGLGPNAPLLVGLSEKQIMLIHSRGPMV
jgi:hypothetical protein